MQNPEGRGREGKVGPLTASSCRREGSAAQPASTALAAAGLPWAQAGNQELSGDASGSPPPQGLWTPVSTPRIPSVRDMPFQAPT